MKESARAPSSQPRASQASDTVSEARASEGQSFDTLASAKAPSNPPSSDQPRSDQPRSDPPRRDPLSESGTRSPRSPRRLPEIAKYELLEEIGHGGMATVYRAVDRRLGREVAVKIVHRHLRENAEVAKRFVAEARAAAKLRHPNIVEVFDVGEESDDEQYLVAELLRGTTLRKVLERNRELPPEIGAAMVLELCDALEHAHASGVVHRDVKPENVLVEVRREPEPSRGGDAPRRSPAPEPRSPSSKPGSSGRRPRLDPPVVIKLTDFGIAKVLDGQGHTATGQILGSPAHMSPEQIEGGDVDERTDVFALGVLLYECFVGHLPFEGRNPAQILRRVLDGQFSAADRERPEVGSRWARLVAKALAKSPADRTSGPGELGAKLREELDALGFADPKAEIASFFADPAAYRKQHRSRLLHRLVARAETCRKHRDVVGAAADYNRALALAPSDAALLRRVGTLGSGAAGRRTQRIALGTCVVVVLGAGAFFGSRGLTHRARAAGAASGSVFSGALGDGAIEPDDEEPLADPDVALGHVPRVAKSVRRVATPPGLPLPPSARPLSSLPRRVKFSVNPAGAKLFVDGQPVSWLTDTPTLSVGVHSWKADTESKCCKPASSSFEVKAAAEGDDSPFVVGVRLPLLPAQVSFSGGPPGTTASCGSLGLVLAQGESRSVALSDVKVEASCDFTPPKGDKKHRRQTLKAGESVTLYFPLD